MMKKILLLILLIASGFSNQNVMGQEVKNFKLVNVLNSQPVSLDSYAGTEGIVLIFTSNSCPYDEYYRKRIEALSQAYQGRVPLILVNSHAEPTELAEQMQEKVKQLQLTIPYLADKDQTLMSDLNVRKSPEAFLLKNVNGKFSIVYRGAIDDNAQVEADVRHHYLRDAIEIMLTGEKIAVPEVRPVGCNVKRKL
ncbi:MAG: redoxin domain-containing protein [Cyclobacteriaceae bacterium]